jgi:uncharacterized protein
MLRGALTLLLVFLAALLALGALLFFAQRGMIYFPQFTRAEARDTGFALDRGDAVLRGWIVNPGAGAPVLYFGGNAESVEYNRKDFARWFPGRTVYLPAYRGYGASDGSPSEGALFADALALYDDIAARHPGAPVSVVGRSLGSGVAAYLASQRPVDRLALVTPFDSMASVGSAHYPWFPVRWLLRERFETVHHLPRHRGALLVIRAGRDQVIPRESSDALIATLPAHARVVELPDADHNDIGMDPGYGRALASFLADR